MIPLADTYIGSITIIGSPTYNMFRSLPRAFRIFYILGIGSINIRGIPVQAELLNIAQHMSQTKRIAFYQSRRMSFSLTVFRIDNIRINYRRINTEEPVQKFITGIITGVAGKKIILILRSAPACIFPFRLGWQTIFFTGYPG
jgi:hypothetical protein